jgi:hypothetical protein
MKIKNIISYFLGLLTGCLAIRALYIAPSYGALLNISGAVIILMIAILYNMVSER